MDNEKTKTFYRGTHDLKVTIHTPVEHGKGYYTEDIAEMLGVINTTNSNPNKRLIDAIVKFYSNRCMPSGGKSTMSERESNGGYGASFYTKSRFDDAVVEFIRGRIETKCREYDHVGVFELCGVKFRLQNPNDWDI